MNQEESIRKIVEAIQTEIKEKANEVILTSQAKAKEILENAKKTSEEHKKRISEKGIQEAEMEKNKIIAQARLEARRMRLSAQEGLIEDVFKSAEERLRLVKDDEYKKILEKLVIESALHLGTNEIEILTDVKGKTLLYKFLSEISEKVKIKSESGPISLTISDEVITKSGIIVRSKDERMEIDNTLETRIKRIKENLRPKVAEILFKS